MNSPSPIQKGLFVGGVGALLVSVLFSVNGWPASELFAGLGAAMTLGFYFWFQRVVTDKRKSSYARHATLLLLVAAIVLKSFGVSAGSFLFLFAFIAFLVWFAWSVLEEVPSED